MIIEPRVHTPEELDSLFSRFEDRSEDAGGLSYLELIGMLASMMATGNMEYAARGYRVIADSLIDAGLMDTSGNITISEVEYAEVLIDPVFQHITAGPTF